MSEALTPLLSVVVATRDRGTRISSTIATLLANASPRFELIVVDQSSDEETQHTLASFQNDSRLRYHRSASTGLSVARNIGLELAQAEIVVMTDDDCEVSADWLDRIACVFAAHPETALVFCDVAAPAYEPDDGWVPIFPVTANRVFNRVNGDAAPGMGIGAGMAVRRSTALELGGFDPLLGAGAMFQSSEETDLALRVLLHGGQIRQTHEARVLHLGIRSHQDGRRLVRGYAFGLGAVYAKLVKCGHRRMLPLFLSLFWSEVGSPAVRSLLRLQKPRVIGRAVYLLKGFARGMRTPIDPARQIYRSDTHLSPQLHLPS